MRDRAFLRLYATGCSRSSSGFRRARLAILAGAVGGYAFSRIAASYIGNVGIPGTLPVVSAAGVLLGAAIVASLMPAARASRVDLVQALRSE